MALLPLATPAGIATCIGALAMHGGVAGQPGDLRVGLSFFRLWQVSVAFQLEEGAISVGNLG